MRTINVVAIDMGSSSVRAVLGTWDGAALTRREIMRVSHEAKGNPLKWDIDSIAGAARNCVAEATRILGHTPDGVGVCGWGVDFVGVDKFNTPTTPARAYRGPQGAAGRARLSLSDWEAFEISGVYPQDINTIFQIAGLKDEDPKWFDATTNIEFLADWVARDLASSAYGPFDEGADVAPWVSMGVGSTSGFLSNDHSKVVGPWDEIGVDPAIVPEIKPELSIVNCRDGMHVIRAGSHDTACAAYSLGPGFQGLFVSCGSWAIAGALSAAPIVTPVAFAAGLTNEATTTGSNRAQVNLPGMWLAQECRRDWLKQGWNPSYQELDKLTQEAVAPAGTIDVNHPDLALPGSMPAKIEKLAAAELGAKGLEPGQILALVHRSVAKAISDSVRQLRNLTRVSGPVAVIGGGTKDPFFVKSLQEEIGELVIGDSEASALGNIVAQLNTLGVAARDIASWQ